MKQEWIEQIKEIVGESNITLDAAMSKHTTFRIGGPAQVFVTPNGTEMIKKVVTFCSENQISLFVLGNGSNLLVGDAGIDGVVMQLYDNYADYRIDGDKVFAEAGVLLGKLGSAIKEASLAGFEFAAGIPGTLGGAVMMNAGAYGGEMKDIVERVLLMDRDGRIFEMLGEEMDFSYRHSIVEEHQYIVLGATLQLAYGDKQDIISKMEELSLARRSKQPLEYPSAGSTFKRPEGYFAGKLIMDAGLRGYQVGGAQVSEKHCGFVINKGDATAKDVLQLIKDVKDKVYDTFQVVLEPEVKLVGKQNS